MAKNKEKVAPGGAEQAALAEEGAKAAQSAPTQEKAPLLPSRNSRPFPATQPGTAKPSRSCI